MPYPQNLETAKEVEGIIRSHGVIPATIGILKGTLHFLAIILSFLAVLHTSHGRRAEVPLKFPALTPGVPVVGLTHTQLEDIASPSTKVCMLGVIFAAPTQ